MAPKPRLGVFKFASCDGCQLSLLDAEDELLALGQRVEIAHFAEASSALAEGPYDIALVEGSITTADDAQRVLQIRRESRFLMTIGACATSGGIQALRHWGQIGEWVRSIYPSPEFVSTLATSTPIAAHVKVDFELRGCPIDRGQLVEALLSLVDGRQPRVPTHDVCLDCKRRGTVCVMVAQGAACLGPITRTGCGAICPTYGRGCYGCHGPAAQPNADSLLRHFTAVGHARGQLVPLLRNFNAAAPEFRQAAERCLTDDVQPGAAS